MSAFSFIPAWLRRTRQRRQQPRPRSRPVVEQLEQRLVPDSGLAQYVSGLYADLLHRAAQPSDVDSWVNVLNAGVSRALVAQAFTSSTEYLADQITADYRQYLGRDPEAGAVGAWLLALRSGLDENRVAASILASPEVYNRAGGQPGQWLARVYQDVLGRAPDDAGLGSWVARIQSGTPLATVAQSVLGSGEAKMVAVNQTYQSILHRPADPTGAQAWVAALSQGVSLAQMAAAMAGAAEYMPLPSASSPSPGSQPSGNSSASGPSPSGPASSSTSPFVSVTGISGAHGSGSLAGLTSDKQLKVSGTGTPGLAFTLSADGLLDTPGMVGADGTWQVALPGPLTAGSHLITAHPVDPSLTFDASASYLVTVDLTPPPVKLYAAPISTSSTPLVTIDARTGSIYGFTGVAHVDVDLNHDGNFNGPGERDQTLVSLGSGLVQANLNPLPAGTFQVQVRVTDLAGNEGVSLPVTIQVAPSTSPPPAQPRRLLIPPPAPTQELPDPSVGVIGSQALVDLATAYISVPGVVSPAPSPGGPGGSSGNSLDSFLAFEKQFYVFNDNHDALVRVRLRSREHLEQAAEDLKNLGMTLTDVVPTQDLIVGYLPLVKVFQITSVTDFGGITPVYAAIHHAGSVTTQGDAVIGASGFRAATGKDGTGVTVGAISDSVNQVDSHADANPDKGIAESQRTGELPASGVKVLKDGSSSDTDEGRGILEIVHDVAPGAKLAFTTADGGPQAMAQGIVNLATQAGANVIVDDVSFPDEPFFNDGIVARAVNQVVNQNNVVYVTSAGNEANNAWTSPFQPVSATLAGVSGTFANLASDGGQNLLQHFTLQKGQTLDLSFQWDSAFLEGGSIDPNFKVTNSMAVRLLDGSGTRILRSFADINPKTGEAMQRVIFTNDGSFGTTNFALAYQLTGGQAPTQMKWIRFDKGAPAENQGASAIWGHAAAAGALTVGAVPWNNIQSPEAFTSQGKATILFDAGGHRLARPEVRTKPDVAGPDGVYTANFPAVPAGQTLAPDTHPVFTGTSAAAAHVAGAAALLRQQSPSSTGVAIDQALIKSALDVGPSGWDTQTGAGLVQLAPSLSPATPPTTYPFHVGSNVNVSQGFTHPATGSHAGSHLLLNAFPNVNTSRIPNNEWEEDIAIDPTNPSRLFVAANQDTSTPGLFVSYSTDGGATWKNRIIADGNDKLIKACCDPSVAWDNFGNLFLSYLNDAADTAVLVLSTDGGKTFAKLASFSAADQPKVAVGANSVWMVFNNSDVEAAGAKVTGLGSGSIGSFTSAESVPNSDGGNFGNITIGPQGQVLVSFQSANSGSGPDTIMTALDPDGLGSAGFNDAIAATPTNVGSFLSIPAQTDRTIDADGRVAFDRSNGPHQGRVYLDYVDSPSVDSSDTNIFVRYSDDNGTTWSNPVQVNDDPGNNSQFWPRLAVDQTSGNVAISWYDARNDTGSGPGDTNAVPNDDVEMFASGSIDGGNTFFANVQIAQGPSSAVSNDNNGNQFGDYTGIAFYKGVFYPAWADNSNSTGDNPDGKGSGFDVYTARVDFSVLTSSAFIGEDRFEPNDTSDRATRFGVLNPGTQFFPELSIFRHANGLYDYDWYRWTAGASGPVTVTIANIVANGGDLNLRVDTLNSHNTLVELGSSRLLGGVKTQKVTVAVTQGKPLLVWVYGYNFAQGSYEMSIDLAGPTESGGGGGGGGGRA